MNDAHLELAQLLCTRLCHDLAGPVGAVAAGVELIGGDPAQADAETLELVGNSSAAASLKLKFMRAALGAGVASGDPKSLLDGYLEATAGPGGKPAVTWPRADAMAAAAALMGAPWFQTLLNLCLLALEAQAACRALAINVSAQPLSITIESRGASERVAVLKDELIAAVAGAAATPLTAKTVHAGLAGRMVRAAGGTVSLAAAGNCVTVTATYPASAGRPA